MQRLLGVILPDEKRIDYALTLLYGVGWTRARAILKKTDIAENTRVKDISDDQIKKLSSAMEEYALEGQLREERSENIKRLTEIGSYRGRRHRQGLPARGQRTRSNARTKRGKRQTVGSRTKEAWAKMEQGSSQK